jgi:hypothetical protein
MVGDFVHERPLIVPITLVDENRRASVTPRSITG